MLQIWGLRVSKAEITYDLGAADIQKNADEHSPTTQRHKMSPKEGWVNICATLGMMNI